ncbi:MAG: fibrobacter succinogenes major paralogous domain-containing protein [Bacteroidales bacterium]
MFLKIKFLVHLLKILKKIIILILIQGVCPDGWHLPSDAEWTELTDSIGGITGGAGKLKEAGTDHWSEPNTGATNETGFTALPGGVRDNGGSFYVNGISGHWWSATEDGTDGAWGRSMYSDNADVAETGSGVDVGLSIRCVKD